MSDDAAFRETIRHAPDDDLPRLVYADYLDDRGDPRGQFIRAQCRIAQLPEDTAEREEWEDLEWELLKAHEAEWLGEVPAGVTRWEFRRGFVERVVVSDACWVDEGARLCERWLVRDVEIGYSGDLRVMRLFDEWNRIDSSRQLEAISLPNIELDDAALSYWLSNADLSKIRRLNLSCVRLELPGCQTLTQCRGLPSLIHLGLSDDFPSQHPRWIDTGSCSLSPQIESLQVPSRVWQHLSVIQYYLETHRPPLKHLVIESDYPVTHDADNSRIENIFVGEVWKKLESLTILEQVGRIPSEPRRSAPLFPVLKSMNVLQKFLPPEQFDIFLLRNAPRLQSIRLARSTQTATRPDSRERFISAISTLPIRRLTLPDSEVRPGSTRLRELHTLDRLEFTLERFDPALENFWPAVMYCPSAPSLRLLQMPSYPPPHTLAAMSNGGLRQLRYLIFPARCEGDPSTLCRALAENCFPNLCGLTLGMANSSLVQAVIESPRLGKLRWFKLGQASMNDLRRLAMSSCLSSQTDVTLFREVPVDIQALFRARLGHRLILDSPEFDFVFDP